MIDGHFSSAACHAGPWGRALLPSRRDRDDSHDLAGFSTQYLAGRSTFASPVRVHLHAFFFMGWVAIYLLQNIFVATGRMQLHRRLGWVAAFWIVPMVIMGTLVTAIMVRQAHVPFFFRPLQFLVFDPVTVLAFAGLTVAAVRLRRRTEWHRRLHFCGMSLLLGPAFGRLLPLPLLQPWAWEATMAVCLLFPIAGMIADIRRGGRSTRRGTGGSRPWSAPWCSPRRSLIRRSVRRSMHW